MNSLSISGRFANTFYVRRTGEPERLTACIYYTGDYAGIESMTADELKKLTVVSVLLWRK